MSDYCLKTRLNFVSDELAQSLLEYADSESDWVVTSVHDYLNSDKESSKGLVFLKLDDRLLSQVLNSLPECFKFDLDNTFVRLQIANDVDVLPHFDKGRTSGIFVMLTDNTATTHFYDWKPGVTKTVTNEIAPDSDKIDLKHSVTFQKNETWLFNHAAIHSVDRTAQVRVTLNILYTKLPFVHLANIYKDNYEIS